MRTGDTSALSSSLRRPYSSHSTVPVWGTVCASCTGFERVLNGRGGWMWLVWCVGERKASVSKAAKVGKDHPTLSERREKRGVYLFNDNWLFSGI
jgi:hypothetical protein